MPTPIYKVKFNDIFLPGFVQSESAPLQFSPSTTPILGRAGSVLSINGVQPRRMTLDFIVLTRLGAGSTELQHLNDCKNQVGEAAGILSQISGPAELRIGNLNKIVMAVPDSIDGPISAGRSRSVRYKVDFIAQPYWRSTTPQSDSFSGNTTLSFTMPATLDAYPIFTIPSTVTAFIATHAASGKTVDFLRDTVTGQLMVDCGTFRVYRTANDADASRTMQNVNYGIVHSTGAGALSIPITGYAGSGSVTVNVHPRYAWND